MKIHDCILVPSDPLWSVIEELDAYTQEAPLDTDIIVFRHEDLDLMATETYWMPVIESAFAADGNLAILGLGGATGIGVDDIYKVPYHITHLQRINYMSHQTDWKIHGEKLSLAREPVPVAVIDGFFMAIRASFLKLVPWPSLKTNFHCYDTAMCLMAHRLGFGVKAIGISCTHHGGGTSTKQAYIDWCVNHATTPEREHAEPHVWLYNEFRDLLPLRVG